MDLRKIIHELELEKQRLDEAITALERLSDGNTRRNRTSRKRAPRLQGGPEHITMPEPSSPALPAQSAGD